MTALIAAIGDGSEFRIGRRLAAWLRLLPHQHSSGDRHVPMAISKRGFQPLRAVIAYGARAVVRTAPGKTDPVNQWINHPRERRGSTGPRLLSPTRQHGWSGPCC